MPTAETRPAVSAREAGRFTTQELREAFVMPTLMQPGTVQLVYIHYDRFIAGGAVPTDQPLQLEPIDALKADFFLARRELGVVNLAGAGRVVVDGQAYPLQKQEALYVGQGHRQVRFEADQANNPPHFYLCSAPAHAAYPVQRVAAADVEPIALGSPETANARLLRKLIVNERLKTCQLQMGITTLQPGSVWNTMPPHTHDRRMEVYFYFDVPDGHAVAHLMGEPTESRTVWLHNEQAVISPPWSMHAGAGTASYSFVWAMAGENLDYADMDQVAIQDVR